MSRIGKRPVELPSGVTAAVSGQTVEVKGPKGARSFTATDDVTITLEDNVIKVDPRGSSKRARQQWGMSRTMVANLVTGVTDGFKKELEINGVGYRALVKGKNVDLTLGFSHPISYPLPEGVSAEVTKDGKLVLTAADKVVLGQVASDIRDFRPPEPYKGKGVKYEGERIIRKEGKRGKK